ncbi:MAG: molybdenum cofactor guanylyltransferase [Bacteroidota bacterium]|nr:molybdenum cofactor guanylyltransferase [Bacteroidota bacterium]
MDINNRLLGAVMCGGKSTRMGVDKSLLSTNGVTWGEMALRKLFQCKNIDQFAMSINSTQVSVFKQMKLPNTELVKDCVDIQGPLGGILSLHQRFPNSDILIIGCDIIDINKETIENLILKYEKYDPEFECYLYSYKNEPEPLLSLFSCKALQKINRLYEQKKLQKFSMKYILESLKVFDIELNNKQYVLFKNYNHKSDLIDNNHG